MDLPVVVIQRAEGRLPSMLPAKPPPQDDKAVAPIFPIDVLSRRARCRDVIIGPGIFHAHGPDYAKRVSDGFLLIQMLTIFV